MPTAGAPERALLSSLSEYSTMCHYASSRFWLVAVLLHLCMCSTTEASGPMKIPETTQTLTDWIAKQTLSLDEPRSLAEALQALQIAPTAHPPTPPSPPPRRCFTSPPAPAIQAAPPPQGLSQEDVQDGDSLHAAAARDDADALVALLRRGARLQERDARGDTALHVAAREGAHAATAALLLWGADARTRGALLRTPLHAAAAHGQLESARRLVEAGARLGARDARGATALALAARLDSPALLEWLLERGGAVEWAEWADAAGDTALLAAARAGRWARAGWLAARGASPAARGRDGVSPLVLAARGAGPGALAALEAMLRGGALCDAGEVARALAAAAGAAQVWAIAQAAPQEVAGAAGQEALRQAARDGRQEALAALLAAGVDPALPDARGHTALQLAARAGHVASVHALLPHLTARPGLVLLALNHTHSAEAATALAEAHTQLLRGPEGSNVEKEAVRDSQCDVASALVALVAQEPQLDANIVAIAGEEIKCLGVFLESLQNVEDQTAIVKFLMSTMTNSEILVAVAKAVPEVFRAAAGEQALTRAVEGGRCLLASALLAGAGAEDALRALEGAAEGADAECVRALRAGGVAPLAGDRWQTALRDAAKSGRRAALLALLAAGVEVDAKDAEGHSALMLAVMNGHADCVEDLLKAGADVNSRIPNENEDTVLIFAASKGFTEVVRILLKYRANVNFLNNKENTALIISSLIGFKKVVRLLLDARAEVNVRNKWGETALLAASFHGHVEIVRMLLESNSDVTLNDINGKSALYFSTLNGHKEIAQMLRKKMEVV